MLPVSHFVVYFTKNIGVNDTFLLGYSYLCGSFLTVSQAMPPPFCSTTENCLNLPDKEYFSMDWPIGKRLFY